MRIVDLSKLQTFTAVNLLSDPGAIGGPVVIPQAAQIVLYWVLEDGKQGHNVTYGRYTGGFAGTQAQANALLSGLTTGAQWTALAAFFSTTTQLTGVSIRDVNSANQPLIVSSIGGGVGSSASASMPNEVAVVITQRTAKVGRANRGRTYIPGWATNALGAGNIVAAGAVTALGNWAGTFATVYNGQGYTFSLGQRARAAYTSPITGVSYPARAATTLPISQSVVRDNHWDTVRKRGLK